MPPRTEFVLREHSDLFVGGIDAFSKSAHSDAEDCSGSIATSSENSHKVKRRKKSSIALAHDMFALPLVYRDYFMKDEKLSSSAPQQSCRQNSGGLHRARLSSTSSISGVFDPVPVGSYSFHAVPQMSMSELLHQTGDSQRALLGEFSSGYLASLSDIPHGNSPGIETTTTATLEGIEEILPPADRFPDPKTSNAASHGGETGTSAVETTIRKNGPQHHENQDHHDELWDERYKELREFVDAHGHCLVPTRWEPNPTFARWCKRQRYMYRLKNAGEHSSLTDEREQKLDDLGFVWDVHSLVWDERFAELVAFQKRHGHANVPRSAPGKLGSWVKSQRRQYALYLQGQKSHLTQDRVNKMNSIKFEWIGSRRPSSSRHVVTDTSGGESTAVSSSPDLEVGADSNVVPDTNFSWRNSIDDDTVQDFELGRASPVAGYSNLRKDNGEASTGGGDRSFSWYHSS